MHVISKRQVTSAWDQSGCAQCGKGNVSIPSASVLLHIHISVSASLCITPTSNMLGEVKCRVEHGCR